jgi:spore coat polysaccharide biosynthesis predicted glycosyltransferase SpsG
MDKRLIITHKTLHGEQKIEQYEAHKKTKQLMEACNVLIVVYGGMQCFNCCKWSIIDTRNAVMMTIVKCLE